MRNALNLLLGIWLALPALNLRAADTQVSGRREVRAHDPSTIVKCNDEYWLFATGNGILSHHSKDLLQWSPGPRVFSVPPAWTTNVVSGHRGYFWAPDIIALTNRYLLYYSVSSWGKNISAIGLATTPTLDPADPRFRWSDEGIVIQSGHADDFNAIDPAVTLDASGRLWLVFGSFWSGIKLVELNPATGKRIAATSPLHSLARHEAIEAPFIFHHAGYYYLFVNWDQCCKGINSTYNVRVGRSRSITGPYRDEAGKDLNQDGGTLLLATDGPFIGPGHPGILAESSNHWFSCHFYDGTRRGAPTLAIRRLTWDKVSWPVIN